MKLKLRIRWFFAALQKGNCFQPSVDISAVESPFVVQQHLANSSKVMKRTPSRFIKDKTRYLRL